MGLCALGCPVLDDAGTGKDGGNMIIPWESRLLYLISEYYSRDMSIKTKSAKYTKM